ncbi:preprotein translocase subunit SecG [Oceanisphaera avium]|uniref:Protein-export membrane protein SecG n=1 Tax=Oceanisphaera avium TaxID=1903694 RepID=A0A1Y0CXI4_9GAMM|nr:preprotein translocase subunit SecG [Oceanisphaera avium]ART79596.1 preprotein translocase subunit SecG [Oceanisphaera avium]
MYEILLVVYLVIALALIGLVLIQQGKGADMGASFGAGASNTVFGSSGSGNFLTKATTLLAAGFFIVSLALGNLSSNNTQKGSEWDDLSEIQVQESAPTGDVPGVTNVEEANVNSSDVPE